MAAIALGTLASLFLIWFFIIQYLQRHVEAQKLFSQELTQKIAVSKRMPELQQRYEEELKVSQMKIQLLEQSLPNGDPYRWMVRTLMKSQNPTQVEIVDVDFLRSGEVSALPKIPYHAATFSISGKATYHEFGRFLMDFENYYYLMHLDRLELSPAYAETTNSQSGNQLLFRMDVTTLIKPPTPAK